MIFLTTFQGVKGQSIKIREEIKKLKNEKEKNQPTKIKLVEVLLKIPFHKLRKKYGTYKRISAFKYKFWGRIYIRKTFLNFFVNKGSISFKDMLQLIEFVSKVF